MKEKGSEPLTDKEVDEVFNAVDQDGDRSTMTRDGKQRLTYTKTLIIRPV